MKKWGNISPYIRRPLVIYDLQLQLLHSEFPYIWGNFYILFYQCTVLNYVCIYFSFRRTLGPLVWASTQTIEHVDRRWLLSCVYSVTMVFPAQLGQGGGCTLSSFYSIYPLHSSYSDSNPRYVLTLHCGFHHHCQTRIHSCAAHVCTLFSSTANLRESYGSHVY